MVATTHIIKHAEPALPLPPLDDHDAELFQHLTELRFDLLALSEATGRRITELLDWYFSPPIQARIEALRIAAEQTAALWAARCRPAALRALERLSTEVEDPLERRRAASSLATHARPHPLPRRTATPAPAAQHTPDAPEHPDPHAAPSDPAAIAPEPRTGAAPKPAPPNRATAAAITPPATDPLHFPAPAPSAAPDLLTAPGPAPPQVRSAA